MIGITRSSRPNYPVAIALVVGVLLGGFASRLAGIDPLRESATLSPGATSTDAGPATSTTGASGTGSPGAVTGGAGPDGSGPGGATVGGTAVGGGAAVGGSSRAGAGTSGGAGAVTAGQKLTASDVGVTPKAITLVVGLIDTGAVGLTSAGQEPSSQQRVWNLFIADQNKHGGAAGRQIKPAYVTTTFDPSRDATTQQREACLKMIEQKPFFAFGTAPDPRCVAVENKTPLLTQIAQPDGWYAQAQGRLISTAPTQVRAFAAVARGADLSGRLHGKKKIGVVVDDNDAVDAMQRGLIPRLKSLGYTVGYIAKMPLDLQQAQAQAQVQASQMQRAGVDAVIGLTQVLTWIPFVNSADKQQWHPQYIVSDYGALDISSFQNGMPESYAGTVAVSGFGFAISARHPEPPRQKACREKYMRLTGETLQANDSSVGWKTGACTYLEMMVDAINKAGPNPTRAGVGAAVQTLTARNYFAVLGGSFRTGKTDYQDIMRLMEWNKNNGTTTSCNANKTSCWNEYGPAFDPAK